MNATTGLIHYAAYCTCGASCHARNVMAWAHNHVKKCDEEGAVEVQLGYYVKKENK